MGIVWESRINSDFEQIDHRTSRSICDAIGERLLESMRPEPAMSSYLQRLVDELRRRDEDRRWRPPALIEPE